MQIYGDVVLLINILVNSILFLLTAWGTGISYSLWRIFAAAAAGSVYSLAEVFMDFGLLYTVPAKLLVSAVLLLLCFGKRPVKTFLLLLGVFYAASFFLGGAILGWLYFIQNHGWLERSQLALQSVTWKQVSGGLAVGVFLIYLVFKRMLSRVEARNSLYQLVIDYAGKAVQLPAILDTGNHLRTMLGRTPVIVVDYQALESILSEQAAQFLRETPQEFWLSDFVECKDRAWLQRVQIIPYRSVGDCSMILGFRPDRITVLTPDREFQVDDVVVGMYPAELAGDRSFRGLLPGGIFAESHIISSKIREAGSVCA